MPSAPSLGFRGPLANESSRSIASFSERGMSSFANVEMSSAMRVLVRSSQVLDETPDRGEGFCREALVTDRDRRAGFQLEDDLKTAYGVDSDTFRPQRRLKAPWPRNAGIVHEPHR